MNVAKPESTMKIHATTVTKLDRGAIVASDGNEGLVMRLECGPTHRG